MARTNAAPTLEAGYVRAMLEYAVRRGAQRQELFAASGIAPEQLEHRDNRIRIANCRAMMEAATTLCRDPAFGLHFGESVKTEDLSVVWSLVGAAQTVGEAGTRMNRHRRALLDDGETACRTPVQFVRSSNGLSLVFDFAPFQDNLAWIEASMAWVVCQTRNMLATHHRGKNFLIAAHFTFPEPRYRREYDRIFRVPLEFGAERNALLVENDFPTLSMPASNPEVSRILREHVDQLEARLEASKTLRMRVESVMLSCLGKSDVTVKTVSVKLGLSRQTLARRLAAEGTTFEQAKEDLRRKLAIAYFAEKKLSVGQVTYLLGFSEPASFSRAFKRWTGRSPRDWHTD